MNGVTVLPIEHALRDHRRILANGGQESGLAGRTASEVRNREPERIDAVTLSWPTAAEHAPTRGHPHESADTVPALARRAAFRDDGFKERGMP